MKTFNKTLFVSALFFAISMASHAFADNKVWNSYQTPLFSGSYNYSYKIDLPPGTHGMTPQIALSYNSFLAKNKAGWVGAGWEVPISYIQTNPDGTYSLFLNGAKHDLVYVAADSRYHTKIETYLKIEKKTGASNEKGEYWTVIDKDGTEYRFGNNLDSENMVNNSSVTPYVWRWSLDRIMDTNGNGIYFTYAENPTANDQGAVYLSKIEYNNEKKRVVQFILEDTDRPDMAPIVDQNSNMQVARRLAEIRVSVGGQPVKSLKLGYVLNSTSDNSLLASITKFGNDNVTSLPSERFEYTPFVDGAATDLMTKITGTLGDVTTINYTLSSSFPNTTFPENYWAVTSITGNNGMTGPQVLTFTSLLAYENGSFDAASQEFSGYGKVTETRPDSSKVVHTFLQDDAMKGREQSLTLMDSLNALYLGSVNYWTDSLSNGIHTVRLEKVEESTYDGVAANPKVTRTEYKNFDAYGNAGLEVDYGDIDVTGDETYTYREFVYNPDLWIVNKIKHSYITAIENGPKLRESWFYYDRAFDLDSPPFEGNLTKEEHWNNNGADPVTTYKYDTYGNLIRKTDPLGNATNIVYDATYQTFPELVYNAKNHLTTTYFNPALGKPLSVIDPNGNKTTYAYDVFNRLTKIVKPLDSDAFPTTEMQYVVNASPPHAVILKSRETAGGTTFDSVQVIDGLGKTIQTKSEYDNPANMVASDTYYDLMGRVARQSNPYLTDSAMGYSAPNTGIPATQTAYDVLGRPTIITNPDTTFRTSVYDHWTVTATDENGHSKTSMFDSNKKLVQVIENNHTVDNQLESYTTNYQYSPLGEMLEVKDHLGNTSTTEYDSLGRKSKVLDVDLGQRLFGYDLAGNMISQTDARGVTIKYQYDSLNRQTLIDYPNDKDIQFVYDLNTKGTLSMVYDSLGIDSYKYDQRGRKIQEDRTMDGISWTTKWEYDSMDRVATQTYPDNEVVKYTYNSQDKLARIQRASQDILSIIAYNEAGQIKQKNYANGWNTTFSYDPANQRLTGISTTGTKGTLQSFSYTYDNTDNVKTLQDTVSARTETFNYDDLGRLLNAHDNLVTGGFDSTYVYNAVGNLTKETDNKTKTVTQYTYGQGTAKPHAVTGKTDSMPIVGSFVIDNGNAYSTKSQITLNNISMGVTMGNSTDYYMASEDQNFTGASWQPFSTAPLYVLANLPSGFKTSKNIMVYFKVKNAIGESKVKSAAIQWLSDVDGDGIPDISDTDNDNDGIPDDWEIAHGLNPFDPSDAAKKPLGDQLTYFQKYIYGLNPNSIDSDGDGWSDYYEIFVSKTNPNAADTDKDGIPDPADASPNNPYNDGFSENYSVKRWTYTEGGGSRSSTLYAAVDTLGSGFSKSPLVDTDGDGIPDSWEIAHGMDPSNSSDAMRDNDGDGLTNLQEYLNGTNPNAKDSDGDGWNDYQEIYIHHTDPNKLDSDNDGIPDPQDPEPNKQTYVYAISENLTIRNGTFNSGGNSRNSALYSVVSDRIGGIPIGSAIYNVTFAINPESVSFSGLEVGKSGSAVLIITNKGNENLIIGAISQVGFDNREFVVQHDNCSDIILSPLVTCTIDLTFMPKSPGAKGAGLEIQYNDGEIKNASIALAGIATPDITPPDTTITGKPDNLTKSNSAIFTFASNEADSTFECQMDSGAYVTCTSPVNYSGITDGSHTFKVRATDVAGNTDATPASYTWTIDTTPPNSPVVFGVTPTTDTTPTWMWTSGGNGGNGMFRYQLGSESGTWTETAALSFRVGSRLALGSYILYVQERDAAGNWSVSGSKTIQINQGAARIWTLVNGSMETCVNTAEQLQACLYDAESDNYNNIIKVVQGTYKGNFIYSGNENFDLTLQGGYAPGCLTFVYNPELTILDGNLDDNGTGDGVVLDLNNANPGGNGNITVEGFHLKNGYNGVDDGGCIRTYTEQGNTIISGNIISNCASIKGGGLGMETATGNSLIVNNIIFGNSASEQGGGIYAKTLTGSLTLLNNSIADNTATNTVSPSDAIGGGIAILLQSDTATADFTNNILVNNITANGTCADIYVDSDGDVNLTSAVVVVKNNDFNPATGICTSNPSFTIDTSNINIIPGFVDEAHGNYHLINTSSVINMGNSAHPMLPAFDIDGQARVSGTAVDIGADEVMLPPGTPVVTASTPTNNTKPTWTWTTGGGGNGTFRYRLDNPVLTTGATTSTLKSFTPTTALAAGNHTLYVQERNAAGQWSSTGSKLVLIETTKPVNGTVTATPGAGQIKLNWSGFSDGSTGSGIANYRVVYATGITPSSCLAGTSVYTGTDTTYTHTGLTNLTYGYRVCAIDKAGNMSTGATKSAKPLPSEKTPPTGSIFINNGDEWTKSATVKLTLTAADDSQPIQMCISNTTSCATWSAFAASKTWTLTAGNGTKKVNVWFRDTWGNVTPTLTPYSDTIKLDVTAPINGTLTATPGLGQIALSWSNFSDGTSGSGIVSYKVVYAAGLAPANCSTGTTIYTGADTTYTQTGLINLTYGYRVCAIDNAGNMSTGTTKSAKPAQ